jgi:hypothetical protein
MIVITKDLFKVRDYFFGDLYINKQVDQPSYSDFVSFNSILI